MKAQSETYVQLQNIYKTKARQDVAEVLEIVRDHPYGKDVDVGEVETFCKNAAFVKLIHGSASGSEDQKVERLRELWSESLFSLITLRIS